PFRFEGIISYQSGYTQVAGHRSTRRGHGFTTLATAVVEGLNVLDVVTADRVVGQISTEHPLYPDGPVPAVTFLGTRFDNLRIGGHPVKIERCLHIIGPRRDENTSYFEDEVVTGRIGDQYTALQEEYERLSGKGEVEEELVGWVRERYPKNRAIVRETGKARKSMACSLVGKVSDCPHVTFGHVIHVPHFGKIVLAELTVNLDKAEPAKKPEDQEHDKYTFELKMIHLDMGCLAKGTATVAALDTNGTGGHH
ncbi:MAG TPA: hypothetical protein VE398_17370, partial [Acidobacteriota bacterium]|nr:hypothetical protein [Acidobacteriota bacterium]